MTTVESKAIGSDLIYKEMLAESTETKPTRANTPSGQKFVLADKSIIAELDTGDAYFYKASNDSWVKIGG